MLCTLLFEINYKIFYLVFRNNKKYDTYNPTTLCILLELKSRKRSFFFPTKHKNEILIVLKTLPNTPVKKQNTEDDTDAF